MLGEDRYRLRKHYACPVLTGRTGGDVPHNSHMRCPVCEVCGALIVRSAWHRALGTDLARGGASRHPGRRRAHGRSDLQHGGAA
eukprot:2734817-Rhodomonas_salina.1